MRRAVKIKWFRECSTLEEAKVLYKTLVMLHHPDKGGNLRDMQEINAEMDYIKVVPSALAGSNASNWASDWSSSKNNPPKNKAKARTWEDFENDSTIKPGHYTVRITSVRENDEKKYVALVFDIAEWNYVNRFRFEPWYRHCIYLSYGKDWQLKNTRKIIEKINASNSGFDGDFAFCNDQIYKFVGKRIGVRISQKYLDGDGFINVGEVFAV